jgi:hypothetical protein
MMASRSPLALLAMECLFFAQIGCRRIMQISGNIRPQRVCHNKRDVNGELAPKKPPKRYVRNAKLHRRKLQPARAYAPAAHTYIQIKHPSSDEKCANYETKNNRALAICTICDHTQINMEVLSACRLVLHSEFTVIVQLCNSQSAFRDRTPFCKCSVWLRLDKLFCDRNALNRICSGQINITEVALHYMRAMN